MNYITCFQLKSYMSGTSVPCSIMGRIGNHNDGAVLKYPHAFGRGSEAWCADFVSWVMTQSGKRFNNPYCPSIVNQLKTEGQWKGKHNPQAGDLVLFDWDHDGTSDHVGIVKSVNPDGSIQTIEGNTNVQGEREGDGVYAKQRRMDLAGYYIRLNQPTS